MVPFVCTDNVGDLPLDEASSTRLVDDILEVASSCPAQKEFFVYYRLLTTLIHRIGVSGVYEDVVADLRRSMGEGEVVLMIWSTGVS